MDTHVKVAGWLRIVGSAFYLLAALIVMAVLGAGSVAMGASGDADAMHVAPWLMVVAVGVTSLLAILALPGLVTGWGLLNYRPWARILNIVLSAFDLFHVPVGTALGVYSIWVMLQPETVELFEAGGAPARYPTHF
jgi:hypothetical protein